MTFVITETCIDTMDQSCVAVCPVDCIHFDEGADRMLYIDPVECIDCGACQPACPVTAIFPDADVPEAMAHFTEINALWYQDKAAARAKIGGVAAAPAAVAAPSDPAAARAGLGAGPEASPAAAPPAAATPAVEPVAARPTPSAGLDNDYPKIGENGLEGKCALCGQYVIKGGVKFRTKSVLCSDCAENRAPKRNPYQDVAGRR